MRIVHARKKVWDKDYAFENKFTLLVWILSILKWKEYGNEIVLYTDNEELKEIKKIGFEHLYDEINTNVLEEKYDINYYYYWAMPKIIALQHETQTLNNKAVLCDQDVVPAQDLTRFWNNTQVTVWSNKEYYEFQSLYPKLKTLSLPKDYKLPYWFTGEARPLNTGVIYFKNNQYAKEYCDEVFKYVVNNKNEKKNNRATAMCNAEQRMLGEFVKHKKLSYATVQPHNQTLFNKNAFHTHGYKGYVKKSNNELQWNLTLLKMIEKSDKMMYNKLMSNPMFEYEKEEIEKDFEPVKQLEAYYENCIKK